MPEPEVTDQPATQQPEPTEHVSGLRGVITDWGGVMTAPIIDSVTAWLKNDGIDETSYRTVMRSWLSQSYSGDADANPIRALERGECSEADFERQLAQRLVLIDGGPVEPAGLLERMFAFSVFDLVMHDVIRAARRAGLRTGLLSNSWGGGYPRELFPELFDAVVISGEVGMRKPEERIFLLATELMELEPGQCVFIDDIKENVAAAAAAGLVGVHHRNVADTVAQLTELLGIQL